jgi:hypothetical protein
MHPTATPPLAARDHYPLTTRILVDLYNAGALPRVRALNIEPTYGYVGRVVYDNGAVRMFRRTNVGVNNHGACEMSKDKGYTKYFLQLLGHNTPAGRVFLMPRYHQLIDRNLSRYGFNDYNLLNDIHTYIEDTPGYPVFIKPNDESQGKGVEFCANRDAVARALARLQADYDKIIVEQAVALHDYRVVVFDGRVVCAYGRQGLMVWGDGKSTIRVLIQNALAEQFAAGRPSHIDADDPRVAESVSNHGYTLDTVLRRGVGVEVTRFANLSSGGRAIDVTEKVHLRWQKLCIAVTRQMGLRLCGVDLLCDDITDPTADHSILETNASPGLDNYAALNETAYARVVRLYREVFGSPPREV